MHLRVKTSTYFKTRLAQSADLPDADKTLIPAGELLDIEYYVDLGDHWQIELLAPTIGDQRTTTWYVYEPDIEIKSTVTLTVVSDTILKQAPKLSSLLPKNEKIFVPNGTQYELLAYLPAENNHLKITFASANLGPDQRNTWYAYQPDVKVSGARQELRVTGDTLFKTQPKLSGDLDQDERIFVKRHTVFELNSSGTPERNHVKVALQGAFLGAQNRTTWYAYVPDIEISGNSLGNQPTDSPAPKQPAQPGNPGKALRFPGFDGVYYTNNPIVVTTAYGERGHFTWGEATHDGTRLPENAGVVYGMIRVAKALEDIRHMYGGRSISINSWYRPPAINRAVGGASQSRHLQGDAVDFNVAGVHPHDVFARLNPWWGSKGGLASSTVFTHIDTRGYQARWSYGY